MSISPSVFDTPSSTLLSVITLFLLMSILATVVLADTPLSGGDDVTIVPDYPGAHEGDLVMTSDGKLFYGISYTLYLVPIDSTIDIFRSVDGGTGWEHWSAIPKAVGERTTLLRFLLAEGTESRLHVLYRVEFEGAGDTVIRHAWVNPNSSTPSWTVTTPFSLSGYDFTDGDLTTDVLSFGDYYVYAVATGTPGGTEQNLYFTRSTNKGDSWQASYVLTGDLGASAAYYLNPKIAFGGNRVHLAFDYGDACLGVGCVINSARTMFADNFVNSGLTDWSSQARHTLASGTVDSWMRALAASPTGNEVYILYLRNNFGGNSFMKRSGDAGSTWAPADTTSFPASEEAYRLFFDPTGAHLYITGRFDSNGDVTSCDEQPFVIDGVGTPAVLGTTQCFAPGDPDQGIAAPALAADPSLAGAFALAWTSSAYYCGSSMDHYVKFDATWFTDPGYPNMEAGLPVALDHVPATPPALAYLGENTPHVIVYSDTEGRVHALYPSGFELGGWPQDVGDIPTAGQVAIGDLNGDGTPAIAVGNTIGEVWAFDSNGILMPGFPFNLGTNAPAYVAIGAVLAPYPRSIVACSRDVVFVLNYRGEIQSKIALAHTVDLPPSIGDVDSDGQPDIVVPAQNWLYFLHPETQTIGWSQSVTLYAISAAVTLADTDLDAQREILVPTVNGWVHDYLGDSTNPWSYNTGSFDVVSRIAAGDIIGNPDAEIIFCSANSIHQVIHGGLSQGVYPKSSSQGLGGSLSDPVIEAVVSSASATIAHSSMQQSWSWTNIGSNIAGWPKALLAPTYLGSAVGDVDDDGSNEIVVLSDSLLSVWDVSIPPQSVPSRKWPMVGGDPGRTNCWMCQSEIVTAVEDTGLPTQLAFAPPRPNPTSGLAVFSFALPKQAGVQIDLYDVRGRRVRQILRAFMDPGEHLVHFDGRDDKGHPLANGQYFARMQVRGGTVNRTIVQKLMMVR